MQWFSSELLVSAFGLGFAVKTQQFQLIIKKGAGGCMNEDQTARPQKPFYFPLIQNRKLLNDHSRKREREKQNKKMYFWLIVWHFLPGEDLERFLLLARFHWKNVSFLLWQRGARYQKQQTNPWGHNFFLSDATDIFFIYLTVNQGNYIRGCQDFRPPSQFFTLPFSPIKQKFQNGCISFAARMNKFQIR